MRLLLASRSDARRRMLEAAGVDFETVFPEFDEEAAKAGLAGAGFEPRDLAEMLSELKAKSARRAEDSLVLGADQILETEAGQWLDKPGSKAEAFEQLRSLSGRVHYLHSAAVVVERGERVWGRTETAAMSVRSLSDAFLHDYLDREYEAVRWNVGGYRIEGPGVQLFDGIRGSHFVILGLPLVPLLAFLRERGLLAR